MSRDGLGKRGGVKGVSGWFLGVCGLTPCSASPRRLAVNIGYCHPYALYGLGCCCPCCPPLPAGPPLAPPVLPPLALPAAPRLSLPERARWGRVPGPRVLAPFFPAPRVPFL